MWWCSKIIYMCGVQVLGIMAYAIFVIRTSVFLEMGTKEEKDGICKEEKEKAKHTQDTMTRIEEGI